MPMQVILLHLTTFAHTILASLLTNGGDSHEATQIVGANKIQRDYEIRFPL